MEGDVEVDVLYADSQRPTTSLGIQYISGMLLADSGCLVEDPDWPCQKSLEAAIKDCDFVYHGIVFQSFNQFANFQKEIGEISSNSVSSTKLIQQCVLGYAGVLEEAIQDCHSQIEAEELKLRDLFEHEEAELARARVLRYNKVMEELLNMEETLLLLSFARLIPAKGTCGQPVLRKWVESCEPMKRLCRPRHHARWITTGGDAEAREEQMWRELLRRVLLYKLDDALAYINESLARFPHLAEPLRQLQNLLQQAPRITSRTSAKDTRAFERWARECRTTQASIARTHNGSRPSETMNLLFSLLGGDNPDGSSDNQSSPYLSASQALDEIADKFCLDWSQYALGYFSYIQPLASWNSLPTTIDSWPRFQGSPDDLRQQLEDLQSDPEADPSQRNDKLEQITDLLQGTRIQPLLLNVMFGTGLEILNDVFKLFQSTWYTAHVADLLYHAGQLRTSMPLLDGISLREHCLLCYAMDLMEMPNDFWEPALLYLDHCPVAGSRHQAAFVENLTLTSDQDRAKLLSFVVGKGLKDSSSTVMLNFARTCLRTHQYAQAVVWLTENQNFQGAREVGQAVLKACLGLDGLHGQELADLHSRIAQESQYMADMSDEIRTCLSASAVYVAFHQAMMEGDLQEALSQLTRLLSLESFPVSYQPIVLFGSPLRVDATALFEQATRQRQSLKMEKASIELLLRLLNDSVMRQKCRPNELLRNVSPSRVLRLRAALAFAHAGANQHIC